MSSRSIPRHIYCAALKAAMLFAAGAGACAQPTPGQATSAAVAMPLPFVSPIFGDNMLPQRGTPDTIWGWSDPGDKVRVQIGDNVAAGAAHVTFKHDKAKFVRFLDGLRCCLLRRHEHHCSLGNLAKLGNAAGFSALCAMHGIRYAAAECEMQGKGTQLLCELAYPSGSLRAKSPSIESRRLKLETRVDLFSLILLNL